ncbi:Trafficking protein particle complex subunit 2 [Porphyridium purpureum]|uniref:Trafficking protein particle complex subunit 2 n=1 Tax=Porphyridium purpureum TaxID=35688 RepID=A0A5J4YZX4_PORPP|nr:Trafficking protein particle complex subunit 2 [Porphyridium purpureum]|eukprot:POR6378..scf208_2
MSLLAVVTERDQVVYQTTFGSTTLHGKQLVVAQLVLGSALDMVDEVMWTTRNRFLKAVDRFNDQLISAFVTAGNYRFLLLHSSRHEDGVLWFFLELYELFVKVTLNPLYDRGLPVKSKVFDERVQALAAKHLG